MVVDTIGKPNAFEVEFESSEFICIVVDPQIRIDRFQRLSDTEIITAVLIERNITSEQCGF